MSDIQFIQGDARHLPIEDESVQCIVTSPPYWGLRKYAGEQEVEWPEWRGAFGLEPTIEMYVEHTVTILREMWRVLRSDGVLFLNIGDSYAGNRGNPRGVAKERWQRGQVYMHPDYNRPLRHVPRGTAAALHLGRNETRRHGARPIRRQWHNRACRRRTEPQGHPERPGIPRPIRKAHEERAEDADLRSKAQKRRESFRLDRELTKARFDSGIYVNRESYVNIDGREYLSGLDKTNRRREVWDRDKHHCLGCGVYVTFEQMEMDHRARNYGQKRHDNLENLQTLCVTCHRGPGGKHA